MKRNGTTAAFLSPDANGWRVSVGGVERNVASLDEVAGNLPANSRLELSLPCQSVVLERHKLIESPVRDQEFLFSRDRRHSFRGLVVLKDISADSDKAGKPVRIVQPGLPGHQATL